MIQYLVKIGSERRPASIEDILQVKKVFLDSYKLKNAKIITHHEVNIIELHDHYTPIFKVGNDNRPASPEDITDFQKEVEAADSENRPIFTHHAVDVIQL